MNIVKKYRVGLVASFSILAVVAACSISIKNTPSEDTNGAGCKDTIIYAPGDTGGVVEAAVKNAMQRNDGSVEWVDNFDYGDSALEAKRCADSDLILMGYGDDAAGLHSWIAMQDAKTLKPIDGFVLVGDPTLNADDDVERVTLARTKTFGNGEQGAGEIFPAAVADRVIQVCSWRDPQCNDEIKPEVAAADPASFYKQAKNLNTLSGHILSLD